MGSRQGRATSVPVSHVVIGEELYGRVEIAAVSSSSKCFLPCRHSRFLDQGSAGYRRRCGKNLTGRAARCGTADVRLCDAIDPKGALNGDDEQNACAGH